MKLPNWLPRLSRKQRVIRNLLAAAVLVFLTWGLRGFAPPTPGLALRWKAETYGLSGPEVLYRTEWGNGGPERRYVIFRSGDTFGAVTEFRDGWLAYAVGDAEFVEPIGPIAFFVEDISLAGPPEAVYAWTDLPEAVRAVCALRLRANVGVYPISAEDDFNWDETYTMEAVPNANGVYRFPLELKYTDGGKQEEAEQSTLRILSRRIRRGPTVDFDCDVTVTFYDEQGEVVHTYEEALAEARYHTKPIV